MFLCVINNLSSKHLIHELPDDYLYASSLLSFAFLLSFPYYFISIYPYYLPSNP